jgi:hypothetical protein
MFQNDPKDTPGGNGMARQDHDDNQDRFRTLDTVYCRLRIYKDGEKPFVISCTSEWDTKRTIQFYGSQEGYTITKESE